MKIFKKILAIILLLFIYTSICAFSYSQSIITDLQNSVFRLHVIANSNSTEDQNLKYLVRDKVLEYINNISNNANTKEEIINIVFENQNEIKEIAEKVIKDNGYDYSVNINIGNYSFPTKTYGDITFPQGNYDALRVEIGDAKGENWWCVMFPPLCFVDVTSGIVPDESKDMLKRNLSDEEYEIISNNSDDVYLKFKIVEMFQNINLKVANR